MNNIVLEIAIKKYFYAHLLKLHMQQNNLFWLQYDISPLVSNIEIIFTSWWINLNNSQYILKNTIFNFNSFSS